MDRIEIPRTTGRKSYHRHGRVPGPQDDATSPAWGIDESGEVFIRCACGMCMGLDHHTIDSNGDVNPSLWHDGDDCGWHVWGRFLGWIPLA